MRGRSRIGVFTLGLAIVGISAALAGNVEVDGQFVSTAPSGPPMEVSSSDLVTGFNADKLDGMDAAAFATSADTYSKAEVDAMIAAATARKSFYLTALTHQGDAALAACASGYHMASMWEIWDLSNLRYATEQPDAHTTADSGIGPPNQFGWIRTGVISSASDIAGGGNCFAWTSSDVLDNGTAVAPVVLWSNTTPQWIGPWEAFAPLCNAFWGVWCMED